MTRELRIGDDACGRRAALIEDGRLVRFALDATADAPSPGDIFLGRVRTVSRALGAAFVDLGGERDGVLMRADWAGQRLCEGEAVMVAVTRAATAGKGPKLKRLARPIDATLHPPARLARAAAPVEALARTAALIGVDQVVCEDAALARALADVEGLKGRIVSSPPGAAFAGFDLKAALDEALSPTLALPSGGVVTIAETEACVAIDVDSGACDAASAEMTALKVNSEAATAIAEAILLRDLAGTLIIDFLPMRRGEHRSRITGLLRDALAIDDRQVRIAGFTRLGLFELRRERRGPSLREALLAPCAACGGTGRTLKPREVAARAIGEVLREGRGRPAGGLRLVVAPAVAAVLRGELSAVLGAAEARLCRRIAVAEEATVPPDLYRLDVEPPARGELR
jgi:ribonuclease G